MDIRLLIPHTLGRYRAAAKAETLSASLGRQLGLHVRVEVAPSYEALEAELRAGRTELAWAPPVVCAAVEDQAHTILRAIRGGRASYLAALVRRASDEDLPLRDLRAAWVEPSSAAGYLLPRRKLVERGLAPGAGREHFTGSYRDAVHAVLGGAADLAPVHVPAPTPEDVRRTLKKLLPGCEDQLVPVLYSDEVPNDGLVVWRHRGDPGPEALAARLLELGAGGSILLQAVEAERLEVAPRNAYAAWKG